MLRATALRFFSKSEGRYPYVIEFHRLRGSASPLSRAARVRAVRHQDDIPDPAALSPHPYGDGILHCLADLYEHVLGVG